jgi:5-methylcytosine-specific restriction enzyme A
VDAPRFSFKVRRVYDRKPDIHAVYGGQKRGGIATPKGQPYIFLFTGESGDQCGYSDGWDDDIYLCTGEGQVGDMQFVGGNRAVRDHAADGKELHLFQALGNG